MASEWPNKQPVWFATWAVWYLNGKKGTRPSDAPKTIPTWAWDFLKWRQWRLNGANPDKRPNVDKTIPQWAWAALKLINSKIEDEEPPPPPPPPPPPKVIAPRTFNKVLPDGSDARFCVTGLPVNAEGNPYDQWTVYDNNGLDKNGGRDKNYQVPGLRQANTMDHYGPCDLYDGLTAWPGNKEEETGSYHR